MIFNLLDKLFHDWWDKNHKTVATPLVFNCYKAGYINAIKHGVLLLVVLVGAYYVVN
jgi:hypothetical protein